jgi:hypothetical protein
MQTNDDSLDSDRLNEELKTEVNNSAKIESHIDTNVQAIDNE